MMANSSRISELASIIQTHTSKIDASLSSKGLPSPSFDVNVTTTFPNDVLSSQNTILEATDELNALVNGPMPTLMTLVVNNHASLISIHAIYRYNIATTFPVNGEATFAEISQKCGLNEDDTRRLLRHAMSYRIFREPRKGVVAHTPTSRVLAEMPLLRQWIGQSCEEMWPSASRVVDAMVKWPGSQEPTEAGFNLANGTQDPIYTEISKSPQRAERFADAMSWFHARPGLEIEHLLENYAWEVNGSDATTTVVDVGGSHGPVSFELAKKFPTLRCVVQDRSEVVASAKAPAELAGRVEFMAHDFFTEQPIKGADIYYFRWILHNWSDKYAALILRALIPALKKGAKVVVSEFCIPDHGVLSVYQERTVRTIDMAMKEVQNAKERDADDWARLFRDADPRFKLQDIKQTPGSDLAIIVASWEGERSFSAA